MQNIKVEVRGTKLVLEVDLSKPGSQTKSGNELVATSGNWASLDEVGQGWSINMVVVKNPKKAQVPGTGLKAVG